MTVMYYIDGNKSTLGYFNRINRWIYIRQDLSVVKKALVFIHEYIHFLIEKFANNPVPKHHLFDYGFWLGRSCRRPDLAIKFWLMHK